MVRVLGFHCRGPGSIPGWEPASHTTQPKKKFFLILKKKGKEKIVNTCDGVRNHEDLEF